MSRTAATFDPLFSERLDVFLEKSLSDIRDFAEREGQDYEQVRNRVAEWHCRYFFDTTKPSDHTTLPGDTKSRIRRILTDASTVNPLDDRDDFLGGTVTGREFWRGLRNGGTIGARHFREYCKKSNEGDRALAENASVMLTTGPKRTPAVAMKNTLYVEMRTALRTACGIKNAEMKWTRPAKLSTYRVKLVGWPHEVEFKNPSKMSYQETTLILRLLRENLLRFDPLGDNGLHVVDPRLDEIDARDSDNGLSLAKPTEEEIEMEDEVDISWACNENDLDFDFAGGGVGVNSRPSESDKGSSRSK